MNPCKLTLWITTVANVIADSVDDDDELGLVGATFTQLGDTITTIAVQRALCGKKNKNDQDPKPDSGTA